MNHASFLLVFLLTRMYYYLPPAPYRLPLRLPRNTHTHTHNTPFPVRERPREPHVVAAERDLLDPLRVLSKHGADVRRRQGQRLAVGQAVPPRRGLLVD